MTLQRYLSRLIALCILPVFALALWLSWAHVEDVQRETGREARRVARALTISVDQRLRSRIAGLNALAASPAAGQLPRWEPLQREALAFRAGFDSHVVAVDPALRVRVHTATPAGEALPAALPDTVRSVVLQAIQAKAPAVGDLFVGPMVQEPLVAVAVPVLHGEQLALVLVTVVPTRQFQRALDDARVPAGWQATLQDGRGQRIAGVGDDTPIDNDTAWRWIDRPEQAAWAVEVAVPQPVYTQQIGGIALLLLLALVAVTLASLAGGRWAARRLTRSVRSLTELSPLAGRASDIAEIDHARRMLDESIARREQAALQAQVREAQLAGIFDAASDAILTTDATQTIVRANRAAAVVFGRPVEALVGAPLATLIPERFRAAHRHAVETFGNAESPARPMGRRDVRALHADGREFPIEAAISHVHIDGQRLYTVILRDVSERRATEAALAASGVQLQRAHADLALSHDELRRLVAQQTRTEENERKRIARELHDELQQVLAAIKMDVGAIEAEAATDPQRLHQLVTRIDELATSAITSTRRIVGDLRPLLLEELGLTAALEALAAQFSRRSGVAATLKVTSAGFDDDELSAPVALCLYRVAQEALNNVAKHAGARQVDIRLGSDGAGGLRLRVADDGRGLERQDRHKPRAFGLLGMGERVRALGGTLSIDSRPGAGTVVEATIGADAIEASQANDSGHGALR